MQSAEVSNVQSALNSPYIGNVLAMYWQISLDLAQHVNQCSKVRTVRPKTIAFLPPSDTPLSDLVNHLLD